MRLLFLILLFTLLSLFISSQQGLTELIDCTDITINYTEQDNLTSEERLQQMDKAFFGSLNKFDLCQQAKQIHPVSASGSSEAGSSKTTTEGGQDNYIESMADKSISGTEQTQESPQDALATEQSSSDAGSPENNEQTKNGEHNLNTNTGGTTMTAANGKLPEDIPPAKNDDALAAQIRYAAENEPDPEKRAQLWNEYRKYRGLPKK